MNGPGQAYPLALDLAGRPVLVAGGGPVAARKVRGLLAAGARVTLVAPAVVDELAGLAGAGRLVHRGREVLASDADGVWLVVAATDSAAANAMLAAEARRRRVFCVRADRADGGTAAVPAVARGAGLTVGVWAGRDPRRASAVRDAIGLLLDTGGLPLRSGRPAAEGSVALIGGGPGDPGLLTVRGRQLLAAADVVVVDKLAPRAVLDTLAAGVEVVEAGKSPQAHTLTQEQINALLVDRARQGKRVVRLKGGDPFVFGRGGEELAACVAAGVTVDVVPGITSAIAVPAAAAIPVTHRGVAQDFTVVSAHADPGSAQCTVDWAALGRLRGTLVLLMAMGRLPAITAELLRAGRPPATPAAVVASGTLPGQTVVVSDLAGLAQAAAGVAPPAVVVIGDVVALRELLGAPGAAP